MAKPYFCVISVILYLPYVLLSVPPQEPYKGLTEALVAS